MLAEGDFLPDETPLLETPTGDGSLGRIDIEYGALVIECKKSIDVHKQTALHQAEDQLAGYLSIRQGQSGVLYAGILTDGIHWRHYRLSGPDDLALVSSTSIASPVADDRPFREWLGSALSTQAHVVPSADTIDGRLGSGSPTHNISVSRLGELLDAGGKVPEVALKRELWTKLLKTAFGTQFEGTDELFVEHTYLVVLATLIARAILEMPVDDPAERQLSGESFSEIGITGVGEAGFFDWMLQLPGGDELVADMARRVACFDWSATDHDVLKALYQSVISPEVRHRLGEYYTPDWLAERIVEANVGNPLGERVLDPACGSGTFLFAAITRFLNAAASDGMSTEDALGQLSVHVAGIDLHPVAVALAQVTYLLAIGKERLADRPANLSVPVYLGDSMRWDDPSTGEAQLLHTTEDVVVKTDDSGEMFAAELRFPAAVVGQGRFDSLVNELTAKATGRTSGAAIPSIRGILDKYTSVPSERSMLENTFKLLCSLHDQGRDHIWGYFVRNQAQPAWFTQHPVDVLVGNPPWLSFRFMPKVMQERFKERSIERGLWKGGARGQTTQQELSTLFIARCVELYLRAGGRFAFVTPFAVLSRQTYEGFRTGRWTGPHGPHLTAHLAQPWSLTGVRPEPFPVPSSVIIGTRSIDDSFSPLPPNAEALSGKVSESDGWAVAQEKLVVSHESVAAMSSDDEAGSPYGEKFRQGAILVPRLFVVVEDGPTLPLMKSDQRSVISRRTSQEKEPWKSLPGLAGPVEKQFVRPVVLGESLIPFAVAKPIDGVIPWTKSTGFLIGDDARIENYPGFAIWWRKAEEMYLAHRSSTKRTLMEQVNYMKQLEAQLPPAPTRVVYAASGNTLVAALLTSDRAVVEHSLYWAPVASTAEGRYLCGVLNAPCFTDAIRPYQSLGAFGPRHFDKYVWVPKTPTFDPEDPNHQEIAALATAAESVATKTTAPSKGGFKAHRSAVRGALDEVGISAQLNEAVGILLGL